MSQHDTYGGTESSQFLPGYTWKRTCPRSSSLEAGASDNAICPDSTHKPEKTHALRLSLQGLGAICSMILDNPTMRGYYRALRKEREGNSLLATPLSPKLCFHLCTLYFSLYTVTLICVMLICIRWIKLCVSFSVDIKL